jgi:acyl-CoA reductase-like NAD-dependent aldehyde dehydrogenase
LVDKWSSHELETNIEKSSKAVQSWRLIPLSEWLKCMEELLQSGGEQKELLAEIATQEMRKPIRESMAEVEKCMDLISYFIQHAQDALSPCVEEESSMKATISVSALFVNEIVKSDPRLPFGGIRNSGYGRELGPASFLEFANIKTVYKAKF